ncbi:MAG: histidine kinase [Gammaproteobacteria bacterium]|nr:histidine kinase [Gammaproteobacteria bacterium]
MAPSSDDGSSGQEFYIPNLCAAESVMIMFILAELLVVLYVLGASELPSFDWGTLALASFFVQWIVLLCAAALCGCRPLLGRLRLVPGVLLSFAIILLVTLVCSGVAMLILNQTESVELGTWWLLRNQLVAMVIGGIALRYFYLQQQLREREQAELQARLESLRARIRPHFLFNSMNSIASLIGSRPDDAERAVEDLSELFRASLIDGERGATVADELHLCKLYLNIEQLRLGERLRVEWDVDESLASQPMPALLLQPLIENAVYHGVARMPEGGTIRIAVQQRGDYLEVAVENPLPPGEPPPSAGHNMALGNIQQRLAALHHDQAGFVVHREQDCHRVSLSYPLESLS